jgi:shikimate kinase
MNETLTERMDPILISGTPCCGKTTFGDWMSKEHGFIHIDMETFQGTDHHRVWESTWRHSMPEFVEYLRGLSDKVVLTWGYRPIEEFPIVRTMRAAGITCWWFDEPEMLARDANRVRGTVSESTFDAQIQRIRSAQTQLLDFYGDRICVTMLGRKDFRDLADIYHRITAL